VDIGYTLKPNTHTIFRKFTDSVFTKKKYKNTFANREHAKRWHVRSEMQCNTGIKSTAVEATAPSLTNSHAVRIHSRVTRKLQKTLEGICQKLHAVKTVHAKAKCSPYVGPNTVNKRNESTVTQNVHLNGREPARSSLHLLRVRYT